MNIEPTNVGLNVRWQPASSQADWHVANKLLDTGNYEQVTNLLYQAQTAAAQINDMTLVGILAAAHQICQACYQFRADITVYQQAYETASRREQELCQQLREILSIIRDYETAVLPDRPPPTFTKPNQNLPPDNFELEQKSGLWQRVQNFLGLKHASSLESEVAAESMQPPMPQTIQRAQALSIPPSQDDPKQDTNKDPIKALTTSPAEETEAVARSPSDKVEPALVTPTDKVKNPMPPPIEAAQDNIPPPSFQIASEPADFFATTEVPLLTSAAEATPLPVNQEIDPTTLPPLSDDAETKPIASEMMTTAVEKTNLIIVKKPEQPNSPTFMVYCLGTFKAYQDDQPIQDWKSSKGKAIFKYLLIHREASIAKEVLMDLFWPDSTPDAARNNLNVAIYGLRQTLRQTQPELSHILFQDDHYLLDPEMEIWVDVEAFLKHFKLAVSLEKRGDLTLAVQEYCAAEALYQGEFLADDRYEEWLIPQRQQLEADYFNLLDRLSHYYLDQKDYDACAAVCKKILFVDPCREEAHCHLMRYYSHQNQRYLALRQYHLCLEALANELDVGPSQTTIDLHEQIRRA